MKLKRWQFEAWWLFTFFLIGVVIYLTRTLVDWSQVAEPIERLLPPPHIHLLFG